ncbi:cell division protein FtsA [Orientia chuto str. Dubai]|uniref:Cell division protein FtsA n=1 Tax=Orientia chuto str. Dubai TaxID=1359168 RepID=A0A0F3MIZ1_9RICK|nr:cell division protein FtsA [Orientia chuto str. Dubai]
MYGKELGCRLHFISANSNVLLNLINCLAKCQIEVQEVVLSIYASALACLTEDEKNLGAIIIDVGAQTTSFGVFFDGKLLYSGNLAIGSWHITSDIAKVLSLNMKVSEKLKVLYGYAMTSMITKDSVVNFEDLDHETNYSDTKSSITISQLSKIIQPRAEEILELVKMEYDKIGVDYLISRCIVLTGGGAVLRGFKELASKIFDKYARIGIPHLLPGLAENCNPSSYSAVIGVIQYYANKQYKFSNDSDKLKQGWFKQAILWLRENIRVWHSLFFSIYNIF